MVLFCDFGSINHVFVMVSRFLPQCKWMWLLLQNYIRRFDTEQALWNVYLTSHTSLPAFAYKFQPSLQGFLPEVTAPEEQPHLTLLGHLRPDGCVELALRRGLTLSSMLGHLLPSGSSTVWSQCLQSLFTEILGMERLPGMSRLPHRLHPWEASYQFGT